MTIGAFERDSPENWNLIKIRVRVWFLGILDAMCSEIVEVEVHREEQTDLGAIRDALNRTDVEDIELI